MRWCRAFLFGLACVSLTACAPVLPFPLDVTKGRAVDVDPKTAFHIGVTTREEVLARLGEPDRDTTDRGHVFVYSWWHAYVGAVGMVPQLMSRRELVVQVGPYRLYYLVIKFDESERVVGAERGDVEGDVSSSEWVAHINFLDASYNVTPREPQPKAWVKL